MEALSFIIIIHHFSLIGNGFSCLSFDEIITLCAKLKLLLVSRSEYILYWTIIVITIIVVIIIHSFQIFI